MNPMKTWKLAFVSFMRHGDCWRLFERPRISEYYTGNSRTFSWWRFAITFDRRKWLWEGDAGHAEMVAAFKARLTRHHANQ